MSRRPTLPEHFKEVEKYWYDRLAQEGFHDIENVSKEDRPLLEWGENCTRNKVSPIQIEANLIYYEKAREFLHNYAFERVEHKTVWELHCEGMSVREIAYTFPVYKKSMVHHIIAKIAQLIKGD